MALWWQKSNEAAAHTSLPQQLQYAFMVTSFGVCGLRGSSQALQLGVGPVKKLQVFL